MYKQYAKVEGQKVIYRGSLPKVYGLVSGFNALTNDELKKFGFLPAEDEKPEFNPEEGRLVFDKVFERDGKYVFEHKFVAFSEEEKTGMTQSKWAHIRRKRDILLEESDWAALIDAPFGEEKKTAMLAYRQKLRDIPQDFSDPQDVEFPEIPDELKTGRN